MMKVFKVSDIKEMQKQVSIGMISFSRMVELMNELAHEAYSDNDTHNVIDSVEKIMKPKYMNTQFTWGQIEKAIKKAQSLPIDNGSECEEDDLIECSDCSLVHKKSERSERIEKSDETWTTKHCPECDSESYYNL